MSEEYQTLVLDALNELKVRDFDEIAGGTAEFGFDDLLAASKTHRLRRRTGQTFVALTAIFELMSRPLLEDFVIDLEKTLETGESLAAAVNDRRLPAEARKYMRHVLRGGVALVCLPFVTPDESLRVALFSHAVTGVETSLRLIAAMVPEQHRAAAIDTLRDLRLAPIDLDALARRQDELREARESLREAREHVPAFRLPPDPSLKD